MLSNIFVGYALGWSEYEWRDARGQWCRTHGNEHWESDDDGLMRRRDMSANDYPIAEPDRRYRG